MTLEEFTEKIEELVKESEYSSQYVRMGFLERKNYYSDGWEEVCSWEKKKYDKYKDLFQVEWYTGGYSGGSCWNDNEPRYESSGNTPEDLKILDEILEKLRPGITFMEYKNLQNKVIKYGQRSQSEYYGNSSDYSFITVEVSDLYNFFEEKGWLEKL